MNKNESMAKEKDSMNQHAQEDSEVLAGWDQPIKETCE